MENVPEEINNIIVISNMIDSVSKKQTALPDHAECNLASWMKVIAEPVSSEALYK